MDSGRYLDLVECNSLEDARCQPIPLSEPDIYSVNKLAYVYFNQYWLLIFTFMAGGQTQGVIGIEMVFLFVLLTLMHFFPFAFAALFLLISFNTNLFVNFSVALIQKYMSNFSIELYLVTASILLYKTIRTESEVYGAFLGTYVLLATISEGILMYLGIPAIRAMKPEWDERRGLLYPARWYRFTNMWAPTHEPSSPYLLSFFKF